MADRSGFRAWVTSLTAENLSNKLSQIGEDIAEGNFSYNFTSGAAHLGNDEYETAPGIQYSTAYLYGRYRRACRKHDETPGPFEAHQFGSSEDGDED